MQLELNLSAPHQAHSVTSRQAARQIQPSARSLRALVLEAIQSRPMTDEEIADTLKLNPSTARPRRVELVKAGMIKQDGVRPTRSGRSAAVWSAA